MALLLLWPLLALMALRGKYRSRIAGRLGFGLRRLPRQDRPRIWIHALSVGEAASSLPLLTAIKRHIPQTEIIFSTTTRGGSHYAERMTDLVDYFVPFPFDLLPVTRKFINYLAPDLFVLIETDFWPNILRQLNTANIPTILANGRVTSASFKNYQRASFLFKPLFNSFTYLSMQVKTDAMSMINLGVSAEKVIYCGNLKYDMQPFQNGTFKAARREDFKLPPESVIMVAGSTHAGEEEIIIKAFKNLNAKYNLAIIIAPRDIDRGAEIKDMVHRHNLSCNLRSEKTSSQAAIMVLDTLGELAGVYTLADLAFIGGSLVPQGGHNPIEPAILGKAVVFGPHMEDFAEISHELLRDGGAIEVTEEIFTSSCGRLLADREQRCRMGDIAAEVVGRNQGAADRYIEIIKRLITNVQ